MKSQMGGNAEGCMGVCDREKRHDTWLRVFGIGQQYAGGLLDEVRGGIVEAVAKMFGSLDSDRFFGMVENEAKPSIDEEVAPFGLESIWEVVKNFWSCFVINFCGVKQAMWH